VDFFGDIDHFLRGYREIKDDPNQADGFTICIDPGHSNKAMRYGNPSPADVIRRVGPDIQVLHLNDNDGLTDQHKMPLSGNINWNDVLDALDEAGYQGVYNMEIKLAFYGEEVAEQYAALAVTVMRNMLKKRYPQDFAE
jgi:sugar phosphate isomerase/epimerase